MFTKNYMDIRPAQKNDAVSVANIHKQEITGGFLSSLKTPFLQTFYEGIITWKGGICLVAIENKNIIGFIGGVDSLPNFYRDFLSRYFFTIIPVLIGKIVTISFLRKVIETIFYPKKTQHLPAAELLTFAISKEFQGKGIGTQLLQEFIKEMKCKKITVFKVLVGKELPAVDFYNKSGFKKVQEISLHNSQQSIVFTYTL